MPSRVASCSLLFVSLGSPAQVTDSATTAHHVASAHPPQASHLSELASLTLAENARIIGTGHSAQERNALIEFASEPMGTMAAFPEEPATSQGYGAALICLTQAIYYEAANEPEQGRRAVAQVVLNRVRHPAYPATVCGVVYEGWDQPVCQFSFVCDGALVRAPIESLWRQSEAAARSALAGHVEKAVGTATHYHADYVLPRWAYTLSKVHKIGKHIFYRFPGSGGSPANFTRRWSGSERIPQIDFSGAQLAPVNIAGLHDKAAEPAVRAADPIDRRTENDVGGRLDPNKSWRLDIPDPVKASAGYHASRIAQSEGDRVVVSASSDSRWGIRK